MVWTVYGRLKLLIIIIIVFFCAEITLTYIIRSKWCRQTVTPMLSNMVDNRSVKTDQSVLSTDETKEQRILLLARLGMPHAAPSSYIVKGVQVFVILHDSMVVDANAISYHKIYLPDSHIRLQTLRQRRTNQ